MPFFRDSFVIGGQWSQCSAWAKITILYVFNGISNKIIYFGSIKIERSLLRTIHSSFISKKEKKAQFSKTFIRKVKLIFVDIFSIHAWVCLNGLEGKQMCRNLKQFFIHAYCRGIISTHVLKTRKHQFLLYSFHWFKRMKFVIVFSCPTN